MPGPVSKVIAIRNETNDLSPRCHGQMALDVWYADQWPGDELPITIEVRMDRLSPQQCLSIICRSSVQEDDFELDRGDRHTINLTSIRCNCDEVAHAA